jgi:hypothetical protein
MIYAEMPGLCTMQSEIEGMIWEVDEDCDQCLTWKEFQDMYHRCRNDQTGKQMSRTCFHDRHDFPAIDNVGFRTSITTRCLIMFAHPWLHWRRI